MKVLLLNPPYPEPGFMRNARAEGIGIIQTQWYPIWLAYATGLLEKHGHICKLIDAPPSHMFFNDVKLETKRFSPDLLVVYTSWETIPMDTKTAETLKELVGCKVVFVGPWASINPRMILEKSKTVDYVAQYEFDFTLLDLANGIKPKNILGLFWRNGKTIIQNKPRPPVTGKQLDEFPFVSDVYMRHLDINNYSHIAQLKPFMDMFTGRGCCWGLCTFCLWVHTLTRSAYYSGAEKYRCRSVDNVIEEIKFIKEKLPNVKEIIFQDDTLPGWRAKQISQAILNEKLDVTWSCFGRVDFKKDELALMKKSGCRVVQAGFESSNQNILNNSKKGATIKQAENFAKWTHDVGLKVHADFILGLPGETEETLKATQKWAYSLGLETYQFTIPKIYPGTPFYEWLEKNSYIKDGEVNYPNLSSEDIRYWARKMSRDYYFSLDHIKKLSLERLLIIAKNATRAVPKLLWERW